MGMEYWQFLDGQVRNMTTGVVESRDTTPPPAVAPTMKLGAFHDPIGLSGWNALQAQVGTMNLIRSYSSGLPNSWAGTGASWHPAGTTTWHSVRAGWDAMASGSLDATLISLLNSVPIDKDLWLTFSHEPENDNTTNTPALVASFKAAQRHFYDVVKANRPETKVGPIYMDWTWNPASGRNPEDWHPGAGYMDFMGIDTYNTYLWPMVGSPTKWDDPVSPALSAFYARCVQLGVPPAIGETASNEDASQPLRKKQWMEGLVNDHAARGGLGVAWFNIYKANDTTTGMLLNSSANSLAGWSGLVDTYVGA